MTDNITKDVIAVSTLPEKIAMGTLGILENISDSSNTLVNIADGVASMRALIVNVCFIWGVKENKGDWLLVDCGLPYSAKNIIEASENLFGKKTKPKGIILTHGHFDHVGSVAELADYWDVAVYAHELEKPFLTGQINYLPPDPSVEGGLFAKIADLYPNRAININNRLKTINANDPMPYLADWKWIHTPGHTPGHISLFRNSDRVLIAGDAFTTVRQDSMTDVVKQNIEVNLPPVYFTPEWTKAYESIKLLESLNPSAVITGHGKPVYGESLKDGLKDLIINFENHLPDHGKYVQ